ncbi:MAG TPA: hypothetical protein VFV97_15985 [Rhodanobacteraceae bacterium]|nr:hypothetical protein [Rhodanobacteraceae bacterium]
MPLRCTRQILFALAVLAAGTVASATAGVVHVGLESAFAPATSAHRIAIEGNAQAGCVPKVARILLDGADVSVELTAPATGCKQQTVPFHLMVDAAATAGLRVLPPAVYRVHVYSGSATAAHLAAFTLIDTSTTTNAPEPESGFWWTQPGTDGAAAAGTGMNLEVQDNQLAASLLGFADSGASAWYFGSTTMTGRVARIPLVQLANGEDWFSAIGTQPDVNPGPRLEIEFLSPTRARGYLVRSADNGDVQVRPLTLSRSAFATGPAGTSWVGRWVLIPEDGGTTRLFDFASPTHRDADRFRLVDAANDAVLDCRLVAGTQQADACTLSASAAPIADFDQVGFDHFAGHGANGAPVQLLRVPR